MRVTVKAALLDPGLAVVEAPRLVIIDGVIESISTARGDQPHATHHFDEAVIVPSFLDIHVHGAAGHDVMEGTSEAIRNISAFLGQHGVTKYLATTVTASMDDTLRAVDSIAGHIGCSPMAREAAPIGIHLEGPFVSHLKRGIHPPEHILEPTPDRLEKLWKPQRALSRL